jgi:hypothetical protein
MVPNKRKHILSMQLTIKMLILLKIKTLEYLNQFHKDSEERKMKQLQEWKKNPIPASEASKKQFEMHKELAKTYPSKKEVN